MSSDRIPMFVKLYAPQKPQNEQINKKQLISLWSSSRSKDFHMIDNPSVLSKIVDQHNKQKRPYSSVKTLKPSLSNPKLQTSMYIVKKTKQNAERLKFGKLSQEINCLSDFIENQVTDLNEAQIFQYKQKMLITFLSDFFQELQKQCHEKALFIKQIWNQMITLFDKVFTIQNKKRLKQEKNSLNEILNVHKKYQQNFEEFKKQIKLLQQERQKHKYLIKSLVINLKQRIKEIKVQKGYERNEYNQRINSLFQEFPELKKDHIDILMYGHENLTCQEAQIILMEVLKPVDQNVVDIMDEISISLIPPKMNQEKSDQCLHCDKQVNNSLDHLTPKMGENFSIQQENNEKQLKVDHSEFKNNPHPAKAKLTKVKQTNHASIQTDDQKISKVSTFASFNYFQKIAYLIVKNKYCQTQNKKSEWNNDEVQTDFLINQSPFEIKNSNLSVFSKVYQLNIEPNSCITMKNFNILSSQTNFDNFYEQFKVQQQDLREVKYFKSYDSSKLISKQKRLEYHQENNQNFARLFHKNSSKNLKLSTKTSKIPVRNINYQNQTRVYTPKTKSRNQNFVRLNKAKISGEFTNMLMDFVDSYYRNSLPECSDAQKCAILLRSYLSNQDYQVSPQKKTNFLTNKNLLKIIFEMNKKIRDCPSNQQLPLSFYYKSKIYKNKNITEQNSPYLSKIKNLIENCQLKKVAKKKSKLSGGNYIGTFTVKKCYKIIREVFELCFKIRSQSKIVNIRLINILQKVLHPSNLKLTKEPLQTKDQEEEFQRTIRFLSFLIENVTENHLFENFLFLCGINYNIQPQSQKETEVSNTTKNIAITRRKSNPKKTIYIEDAVKTSQESKYSQCKFGTMTYSSEVVFYLDMLQVLNCDLSEEIDLMNVYTTLEVLQQSFFKLNKYYRDFNLINNIKKIIEESVKNLMMSTSKLNLFKCLQIFLDVIKERKVKLFKSYQPFYEFVANKEKQTMNQSFLLGVLNVLKAPISTQLKIIFNFFKSFQNQPTFEDMITLFTIEGIPEFDIIQKKALKNQEEINSINTINIAKPSNIVLDYIFSKEKDLKLLSNLQNVNKSFITDGIIEKNVDEIVGQNLNLLDLSWKLLTSQI